jgi:hypothetical protein
MQKLSQRVMNGKGLLERVKHVEDSLADRSDKDDVPIRRMSDECREID